MKWLMVILVFFSVRVIAQTSTVALDTVYRIHGEKIVGFVDSATSNKIYYRHNSGNSSNTDSIKTNKVVVVQYANGRFWYPNISPEEKLELKRKEQRSIIRLERQKLQRAHYQSNYFYFNPLNLIGGNVNMGYLRLFNDGKLAVRMAFKIPFNSTDFDQSLSSRVNNRLNAGAVELGGFIYPFGQIKITYCTGLGIELGRMNFSRHHEANQRYYSRGTIPQDSLYSYATILYYNGMVWHINESIAISGIFGFGPQAFLDEVKRVQLYLNPSINLHFKF